VPGAPDAVQDILFRYGSDFGYIIIFRIVSEDYSFNSKFRFGYPALNDLVSLSNTVAIVSDFISLEWGVVPLRYTLEWLLFSI